MESLILSTALKGRRDYEMFQQYLDPKRWSREFQIVWDFLGNYYSRDREAQHVDRGLLLEIMAGSVRNDKHLDKFTAMVNQAYEMEVSGQNVKEAVLLAKREELAQALAMAIANGKEHHELLQEYHSLLAVEEMEAAEDSSITTYTSADLEALLLADARRDGVIPIYPKALGDKLEGGMQGSDSMILIARPEMGKTALNLTIATGAAREGHKVMLFNNEERMSRLYNRAISCITGLTAQEVRNDIYSAMELAMDRGFGNIIFKEMTPGSPKQIKSQIERTVDGEGNHDTKIIIVDQLRNLLIKADTKTNQLEEAAKSIRNIGKELDVATISVTQAGDSAQDKSILDMGDVDSSNTGIPGACDVLLGVGANKLQQEQGIRVLTPIKNKLSGDHEPFPTRINPFISKYVSV